MKRYSAVLGLVFLAGAAGVGCARTARDTTDFAMADSIIVNAPLREAWQTTKAVLREMNLHIYTRDKRGVFVAYSPMKRRHRLLTPERTQLTVSLEPVSEETTRVTVKTVNQVYGVTLLTHPDWHGRKTTTNETALAILEAVQARLS